MNSEPDLNTFRETIVNVFPNLAGAEFRLLTKGWHSTAVDVDDRLIFKFPRSEVAGRRLSRKRGCWPSYARL